MSRFPLQFISSNIAKNNETKLGQLLHYQTHCILIELCIKFRKQNKTSSNNIKQQQNRDNHFPLSANV